jgi:predicted transcriptional regulator
MRVLLSIKPEFAKLIFEGTKKFEFRKAIFKNTNVRTVVVYASSPMQKVIGEFEIESIINDDLSDLWEQTKQHAGIDEDYFYQYFAKKKAGYAIKIKKAKMYDTPLRLKENFNVAPPQSFLYLKAS